MHFSLRNYLSVFLLLVVSVLNAQTDLCICGNSSKRDVKDDPAKKHARLTHAHLDSAIKNPERARWKAFEESKSRLLRSSSAVAVANWESCGPDNQRGMRMIIRTTSH